MSHSAVGVGQFLASVPICRLWVTPARLGCPQAACISPPSAAPPVQSRCMSLTRVIAAGALGSVLLSGCLSSMERTSSPAIDVDSGVPVMPPEAKAQTDAGAAAFARHFLAMRDYAFATGDLAPLAELGGPTCRSCTTELQVIDMTWMMGGRWEKRATTISNIKISQGQPPGAVDVVVVHSGGESAVFDVKGGRIETYPAAKNHSGRLSLVPSGQSWLVSDLDTGGFEAP